MKALFVSDYVAHDLQIIIAFVVKAVVVVVVVAGVILE